MAGSDSKELKGRKPDKARRSGLLVGVALFLTALRASSAASAAGESFHFAHEISPILAKAGCAAAECHGTATGQGGFKLSLFAGDPRGDYEAIRNELNGRRVDFRDPADSLFLKKPLRKLKHGGGRVFREDNEGYRALLSWIEAGSPYSRGPHESLKGIELSIVNGRARVTARFVSDRGERAGDVTRLALLSSTREDVATVSEDGAVNLTGAGEAWIIARFGEQSARSPAIRSFGKGGSEGPDDSLSGLDRVWLARLEELGLKPSASVGSDRLLRRLYFDLAGRPPSPFEAGSFMKLPGESRLETTVDRLLESDEFYRVFGGHVARWFEVPEEGKDDRNGVRRNTELRQFFSKAVRDRMPLKEIARRIMTERGPDQAWRHLNDPRDRAEYFGRTMLGMSIACARCHNHPLDRWRREEHLKFSAYFTDPRPAPGGGMMAGKFFLPGEGRAVKPELLPISAKRPPAGMSYEEETAWFALEGADGQFARNFANRIFGELVGRSLVDAPDDHRLSNPAIHEPLLDELERELKEGGARLRPLVRTIVLSRLYAMSSAPPSPGQLKGDPELEYLARREARPLSPSQYKRAVESVLGVTIKREPPPETPLARQLYVMNSGLLQEGLRTPGNQVEAIFDFQPDPQEQLRELFQLILTRQPTGREMKALLPTLQDAGGIRAAGRDLAFALLASREFGSLR